MESRWFNSVVVLFWLSTMTWLVVAKVLPPLRWGEPPNYRSIYSESPNNVPPIAWEMKLNSKPLGWAVTRMMHPPTGMTVVAGRVHFDRIPLEELSPSWMRFLIRASESLDRLQMDVETQLVIDPLGHLSAFKSTLRGAGFRDGITIDGEVKASRVKITVGRSGETAYSIDTDLPPDALVSDELSPQSRLVGLRVGQEWTVPIVSPLRPTNNPIEILQARVEGRTLMVWENEPVRTFQVVYRSDSGSPLFSSSQPRAKLWVAEDGTVLRQEVTVLESLLVFTRLPEERAIELARRCQEEDDARARRPSAAFYSRRFARNSGFPAVMSAVDAISDTRWSRAFPTEFRRRSN